MRSENILKFLFVSVVILMVLIGLNFFVLNAVRRQYAPGMSATASLFNIAGQTREWSGYIRRWKDLSVENAGLREIISNHTSTLATIEALQTENDTLRKTAGLAARIKRHLLPAGMFAVSLSPDGYYALINKGITSGVTEDQIVISSAGEIIGKVVSVFPTSSRVMLATDPSFSVTARVLKGQTSGIIRGAMAEGMNFDLVTQADIISEGDIIVTTGDDMIPAGLVVGVVRNVDNNDTQLFKKISVNPAIQPGQGSVVVIQP